MGDSALDILAEMYASFRTEDGQKQSDDSLIVIVSGAMPNTLVNHNVQVTYKSLMKITPKLMPPKIGDIETRSTDVLARTKSRIAFEGKSKNNILFTKQKKGFVRQEADGQPW